MRLYALQSPAGGFLDEDLKKFNQIFDDWCAQFETIEDAQIILDTLPWHKGLQIIEITPLSYPKYYFSTLQGIIHATREHQGKIICIIEPQIGASFRIALCDLKTKRVKTLTTRYKTAPSVEGVFTNLSFDKNLYE